MRKLLEKLKSRNGVRVLLAALCASLAIAAFGACAGGGSQPSETPSDTPPASETPGPEPEEELSTVIVNGKLRIELLSESLVRIEEKGPKGFEDRASYIVSNRKGWKKVAFTQSEKDGSIVLATANYEVVVPAAAAGVKDVLIRDKSGKSLWTYAGRTTTNTYLPSPSDALESWYFTDSPRIIPSADGYSPVGGAENTLQNWDYDNNATDCFVFLPGGDYKRFCADYTSLTGKSEMVSLQTLGYWDSRWYAYSSETALQQIKDYTDRGYSIDVLVIDTDWRKSSATGGVGYEINTDLFPDMAKFLEQCHALGVNVMFNDHPEPVPGTTNGLDKNEVEYRNDKLTLMLSLGLDYWWYDRNWSVALESCSPDISVYAFGMYCYQWITDQYLQGIADVGEYAERALIMGNVDGCLHGKWNYASDLSAHRYSIQWTGDIGSDTTALAQEIYASVFGGAEVGLPYMSSDIGGHTTAVTDEMYSRWMQYGALSTICRVHCTNADYIGQVGRMPWLFGETAEEVTKEYVGMRYRLLPLYYSLARENYDTGLPLMRRLDIEYPDYVESSRNDQYLLGENILVAPLDAAEVMTIVPQEWLSYENNGQTVRGLKGQYYSTNNFTGTPLVKTDLTLNFDWGTGGPAGFGADNFSVIWTGRVTIGAKDARLRFFADDGIKVTIDGKVVIDGMDVYDRLLSTDYYAAGSTHEIKVEYCEFGGNAHAYMYYSEREADGMPVRNTRTVFIPDGAWIDVWSGERFVGPQTITVAHGLKTSPVFVREGAALALAQNMTNTSEKDWSKMALDVYPSAALRTTTTLYEDDTYTQAYKHGQYRKTLIEAGFASGAYTVRINPAQGSFTGSRAFTEREWNVRVHARPEWGKLVSATVNGKAVAAQFIPKSNTASPFAFSGAALDADIYTFTVTGNINTDTVIELKFESGAEALDAPAYDSSKVDFTLEAGEADDALDLSAAGTLDWAYYGELSSGEAVTKADGAGLFGKPSSYDRNWLNADSTMDVSWTDGGAVPEAKNAVGGIVSQKDFSFTLTGAGRQAYYVIYCSGYKAIAKFSVRDRAGNVKTVTFGDITGGYTQRVVVCFDAGAEKELYCTYSVLSGVPNGTGSVTNVSLTAMYASERLPEVNVLPPVAVEAEVKSSEAPEAKVDLTQAADGDVLDWAQFGSDNGVQRVDKIGASVIGAVTFDAPREFYDYAAEMSWHDGEQLSAHTGTRKGTCTPGRIAITLNVDENVRAVTVYTGAWRATNRVLVYGRDGALLAESMAFIAGEKSVCRAVTIGLKPAGRTRITVVVSSSNEGEGGNVSLSAVRVTGAYASAGAEVKAQRAEIAEGSEINLTEAGSRDWVYVAGNARKAGSEGLLTDAEALVYNGSGIRFDDYKGVLSYTDGAGGAAEALTEGLQSDYVKGRVKAAGKTILTLYVSVYNGEGGFTLLDSEGRVLCDLAGFTSGANAAKAFAITVEIDAEDALTFVWHKLSAGGNVGIAAIAVA